MAILHHKETKIQVVLGRLAKVYTHEQFVEMFIKLYSKDWGKIKSAYIKQSQDKDPGTVITMPKPDLYLKQLLETYLVANPPKLEVVKEKAPIAITKKASTKKSTATDTESEPVKKTKAVANKKDEKATIAKAVAKVKAIEKPAKITAKKTIEKEKVETATKLAKTKTKKALTKT